MKKVRITLKRNKTFTIFETAQDLYVWMASQYEQPSPPDGFRIKTVKGDFLEVEWCGAEWIYDSDMTRCLNLVRIAHAKQSENESGFIVTGHIGWVCDGLLPIRNYRDNLMNIELIQEVDARLEMDRACPNLEI